MHNARIFLFALLAGSLSGCSQSPLTWWKSINAKAKEMQELEAKYVALEHEHERLKKDYFRMEHEFLDLKAKNESEEVGELNLKATGSLQGRTPASIAYEIPKGLKPEEQLTLAYQHFTEKRFAESAATFEYFLKQPENAAIADANAMYTAGVAWYQLNNFKKAKEYFVGARSVATSDQRERIQKKVDLWIRAMDHKQKEAGHQEAPGEGTLGG